MHYRIKKNKRTGYWFVEFRTPDGRRHRPSLKTTSKREAEDHAPGFVEEYFAQVGASGLVGRVSLQRAMEAVAESKRNRETRTFYANKSRAILKHMDGDSNLFELTRDDVDRYVRLRRLFDVKDHTLNKELSLLRQSWDRFAAHMPNPVPKFSANYEPRKVWLSPDQAARLLVACRGANAKRWFMLALYAGAEPAAVRRARWDDIDWQLKTIHIRGTKGETRDRTIPLSATLAEYLRTIDQGEPLFRNWCNQPRDLDVWCERAKIPRVHMTDLRRTFGSWLKQSGVDSKRVADLMGHVSTTMVDRVYGQLNASAYREAIDVLPELPKLVAI